MISFKHRFHGLNGLRFVYSNGKTVRSPLLSLRFAPNPHQKSYRVAVVVSKKVNKSAVKRNRMRRRLYEIVRNHEENITSPIDLVITVFSDEVTSTPSSELEATVIKLMSQANISQQTNNS
jgi:ribonuclease P protein component